jgi:hypothetical protein
MTAQEFQIDYKKQKPVCKITSPGNEEWILQKTFTIQGQVDPESVVTVGEQKASVDAGGFFILPLTLSDPGLTNVSVTVVDPYGNQGDYPISFWFGFSIRMQINSRQAYNNNQKRTIDLAPFIRDSRTMVPFRFLGEELQAKISFKINPVSKLVSSIQYELQGTVVILTIGDIQGTVNEKEVLLDAPPIIIKGRTVVPLRFITENLGCKTVWEPNTKSIQVAYAPKS